MTAGRIINTPIGDLTLISANNYIIRIAFGAMPDGDISRWLSSKGYDDTHTDNCEIINKFELQLYEYFCGDRLEFDVPFSLHGTQFQRSVWAELRRIPYGRTSTYGQIAERIGNPKTCRAVGMANNKNLLPILVPCHRVIGSGGGLTGFAGGLDIKARLLELECGVLELIKATQ